MCRVVTVVTQNCPSNKADKVWQTKSQLDRVAEADNTPIVPGTADGTTIVSIAATAVALHQVVV
jgi:hypothetical protein